MDPGETTLRVAVIGLDGGTFDLIQPWAEAGHLPTFRRLMENGVWGDLRSTMPPITAPAWSSFITGRNPGRHGLIDFIYRRPGTYTVSPVNASFRRGRSLWSLLSSAGKKVIVVNVPMTYPPEEVNGVMVTGLMTPSEEAGFTYPPELARELRQKGYRIHAPQSYAQGNIDRFLKAIEETTSLQLHHLEELVERESWDFMMYVFRGPDRMQHGLWHFMDPEHPLHGAAQGDRYRDAIRDHYVAIDRHLARLEEKVGPGTLLILMSDHGFGPFHKYIYMNNWLMKWGMLRLRRGPLTWLKKATFNLGLTPINIYNLMLKAGLGAMKGRVTKGKGQKKLARFFLSFRDIDWSRTTAYSLGNAGQLWINLEGREPTGIVSPGAEYNSVLQELTDRLKEMRDPETGQRLVDEIYTRDQLYSGPHLEQMPDLVFVPSGFRYLSFGEYEFASNRLVDVSRGITGWHRMNGMALFHGPPVQGGAHLNQARIEDMAPTILYAMGQPVPASMDGRALTELFKPAWNDALELERRDDPEYLQGESAAYSDEDEAAIRKRLEDLGYLG